MIALAQAQAADVLVALKEAREEGAVYASSVRARIEPMWAISLGASHEEPALVFLVAVHDELALGRPTTR